MALNLLGTATANAGSWNFTTSALTDGGHSFTAVATDNAGNTTTTAAVTATVDTTAATGGTPDLVAASDSGSLDYRQHHQRDQPDLHGRAQSDGCGRRHGRNCCSAASALAHTVTHTITSADVTAGSVSLTVTAGDLGADGSKSISAKFTDAAGNTSTTSALAVTLDTTTPTGGTPDLVAASDTGSLGYRQHHRHHQPDLHGRAQSDGCGRRHRRAAARRVVAGAQRDAHHHVRRHHGRQREPDGDGGRSWGGRQQVDFGEVHRCGGQYLDHLGAGGHARHDGADRRHAGPGCGVGLRKLEYRQHHQRHQPDLHGRAQSDGGGRRHGRNCCSAGRRWRTT